MKPRIWRWGDDITPLRDHLRSGGVVGLPTESSYGLGADPRNEKAVATIARIKRRRAQGRAAKPLPVVVANREQIFALGINPAVGGLREIARHWPGPLSIVLPLIANIPAAGAESSLAVRIPGHRRLQRLLLELGHGLTATSANLAGQPPILDTEALIELVGEHDSWVIDDGTLAGGPPSTLVRWAGEGFDLLREGRYPFELLEPARAKS